jgi:hypothetical protein
LEHIAAKTINSARASDPASIALAFELADAVERLIDVLSRERPPYQ